MRTPGLQCRVSSFQGACPACDPGRIKSGHPGSSMLTSMLGAGLGTKQSLDAGPRFGTVEWWLEAYMRSPAFAKLADRTQPGYRYQLAYQLISRRVTVPVLACFPPAPSRRHRADQIPEHSDCPACNAGGSIRIEQCYSVLWSPASCCCPTRLLRVVAAAGKPVGGHLRCLDYRPAHPA